MHRPTIAGRTLAGCWTEGNGARALNQKSTASAAMTLEVCAAFCDGYKYFGTEYSSECFCGDFLHATSSEAPISDCSMTCSGNPYQYCGAGNRLELYVTQSNATGPSQPPTVGAYSFEGCKSEGASSRALTGPSTTSDTMTNAACATFCSGYSFFGTEYGRECYCGNTLSTESFPVPATECNMLCSGANAEYCGAGNRLSVYRLSS
jgi:hypothetical protein